VAGTDRGAATAFALRDLERADARRVIALAVGELVSAGAWELRETREGDLLVPRNVRPPAHEPCAHVDELLRAAPKTKDRDVSGRAPRDVAEHLAGLGRGQVREPLGLALDRLIADNRSAAVRYGAPGL